MASTTYLKSVKPTSEQDAQKVATYNDIADEHDSSLGGILTLDIAGTGTIDLTKAQALNPVIKFTGALTAGGRIVRFPITLGTLRRFTIWNATTGAFSLTLKTTAGGTGLVVTQTKKVDVFHDGTEVYASSAEV